MKENKEFLTEQIITYIGNKRGLLDFIGQAIKCVKKELKKDKLDLFDVFSGSGIVARYFKQYANRLYVNDLEDYSKTINECYLTNKNNINFDELNKWYLFLKDNLKEENLREDGFIYDMYAPKDDSNILEGERVFYTSRNAKYLDTARQYLDEIPQPYRNLLLGPLIYEASTKNNTSGVFKGFYKNSKTNIGQFGGNGKYALNRIMADIEIKKPVLSDYECEVNIFQGDSNKICKLVPEVDMAYLDPPYNQHPYSSNYFMLNLLNNYIRPLEVSSVSGIPTNWKKSIYNKKQESLLALSDLCKNLNAKYILISFSSEGFISYSEMVEMLKQYGRVRTFCRKYNVFRGCRNLSKRCLYLKEYLFLLKKEG